MSEEVVPFRRMAFRCNIDAMRKHFPKNVENVGVRML